MTLQQIAQLVGVEDYPADMEQAYRQILTDPAPACDIEAIDRLQQQYDMFGRFYDLVREYAHKVNEDPARSLWVKTAVAYARAGDFAQANTVPVPAPDGTQLTALLPFYILVGQIPESMDEYRRRGFSEEETVQYSRVYKNSLATVEARTGMPGTDKLYYGWAGHYAKVQIFKVAGLQFEMRKLPGQTIYLRHKTTGQIVPLMLRGTIHRSGIQHTASAGFQDDRGAFTCSFREDAENYYGHGVREGIVSQTEETFPKNLWECALRPGDPCLGMHIPRGADISNQAVDTAIAAAHGLIEERFPEFSGRLVYCSSWLLDPTLGKLLGENSRITGFQNRYVRHPQVSAGMHVFGHVFPKKCADYTQLPENTRLERVLKDLYLNGGHIYAYAGVIF